MTTSMPGTALARFTSSPSVNRPSFPACKPPWLRQMTKARTTALNHEMAAKHRLFGQALKVDECRVRFGKVDVRHDDRRRPSGFGGYRDRRPRPVRPEVELVVAE